MVMLHTAFPATAPYKVVQFFFEEIASGRLMPNAKILSERELSERLAVSRGTVRNASADDFQHMAHCLQQSELATSTEFFEYWDGAFHKALADATHNPFFSYLLNKINEIRDNSEWGVLKKKSLTAEARAQYQKQHQDILAALKKRDAKQAQQLLLEHLWLIEQHLFRTDLTK